LTFDLDETGKKVAALIVDLQSDDVEKRALAEKALVEIGRPAMEQLYLVADDDRPEVLLRAASAMRQIEDIPEELPTDPALRAELEKQREEQRFDEARRRAEYAMRGIDNERARLFSLLKDAQAELAVGKLELTQLKYVEEEKRKSYADTLAKIETALQECEILLKAREESGQAAEMKK
jgi:vacuolar-type H+-ATPase subunit I/STV1